MIAEAPVLSALQSRFPGSLEVVPAIDQPTVRAPKEMLIALMDFLKRDVGMALLLDVTAVDWFPARPRFEVVYHLLNPDTMERLRVKTWVHVNEEVPSVMGVWPGADWPERETYDLFGVRFSGRESLERIYMPEDWEGHPLRKDYPVAGPRVD
jgi:NADH-quinone oxidoreductase subunit C